MPGSPGTIRYHPDHSKSFGHVFQHPDVAFGVNMTLNPVPAAQAADQPLAAPSIEDTFCAALIAAGMRQALGILNARTRYRFTALYRVEPPLLHNECLFDRENPTLSLGGDVNPLNDTYCGIVAKSHKPFAAVDARTDPRLTGHAARDSILSYVGVPIRASDGRIFASLCHFDFRPRLLPLDEIAVLESVAVCLSGWLARARGVNA